MLVCYSQRFICHCLPANLLVASKYTYYWNCFCILEWIPKYIWPSLSHWMAPLTSLFSVITEKLKIVIADMYGYNYSTAAWESMPKTMLLWHNVARLGVLETWVSVSRPIFTSLGLGLGLGTSESWSWSWSWISKSWSWSRSWISKSWIQVWCGPIWLAFSAYQHNKLYMYKLQAKQVRNNIQSNKTLYKPSSATAEADNEGNGMSSNDGCGWMLW